MENGRENKIGMNQVAIIAATVIGFGIGIFSASKPKKF